MAALLILGGFVLIALGLLWLVALAFQVSVLWGVSSLFPPMLLVFVIRCWSVARKAVIFTALGCVPVVAGFTQLSSQQPERVDALLNLSWLQPVAGESAPVHINLHGELYGQPFKPHYGELLDGVLVLREGDDFFAQRELRITLPAQLISKDPDTLRLDVLPQDTGVLPDVEIMWLQAQHRLPEARRINRGYTLYLDLHREAPNTLRGGFHLVLPTRFKTSMSGEVQLKTDHLNYVDGKVDRQFDAVSTLEFVLKEYLQRRYRAEQVHIEPFVTPTRLTAPLTIKLTAHTDGLRRTESVRLVKNNETGWQVAGEQYPQYFAQAKSSSAQAKVSAEQAGSLATTPAVDRRIGFSLQRLLVNPLDYLHLTVHIVTSRGNQVTGRFMGLTAEDTLIISREVQAPGSITFTVLPTEVEQITLLQP